MASPTPGMARLTRRGMTAALLGASLVTLGSCSYRTRWQTVRIRNGVVRVRGGEADGVGRWAIATFPLGLFALCLVAAARVVSRGERLPPADRGKRAAALMVLAAVGLTAASWFAGRYWQTLLAGFVGGAAGAGGTRDGLTTRLVTIAWGLPIVTIAGAFGALACLILARAFLAAVPRESGAGSEREPAPGSG